MSFGIPVTRYLERIIGFAPMSGIYGPIERQDTWSTFWAGMSEGCD